MTTQSGRNTRTLVGYVSTLLEYPRWMIERDVDFTNCRYDGIHDATVAECSNCGFGEGCYWLNQNRAPSTQAASFEDLALALQSAVQYVQSNEHRDRSCSCRTCGWLREARHFLHTRRHLT